MALVVYSLGLSKETEPTGCVYGERERDREREIEREREIDFKELAHVIVEVWQV